MRAAEEHKEHTQTMTEGDEQALPENAVPMRRRARQAGIRRPLSQPASLHNEGLTVASPLIQALWRRAATLGMSTRDLAARLGISYPYLMHLANPKNPRSTDGPRGLDREVMRRAAEFLEIPLVQAYVLANILKPEDFFYKPTLDEKLESAYRHMTQNGLWCGFAPTRQQWDAMSRDLKLSFVMLYEQVVNRGFLDRALVPMPSEPQDARKQGEASVPESGAAERSAGHMSA